MPQTAAAPRRAMTTKPVPKTPIDPQAAGPMLRYQKNLPKLPVPPLAATMQKYLQTVRPLLNDADYEKTVKAVQEFQEGGVGEKLQERLLARANDPSIVNWMEDWWLDQAYMGYRDPIVIYVSYFFGYKDDKLRRTPAKRAAAITTAALEFKRQIVEWVPRSHQNRQTKKKKSLTYMSLPKGALSSPSMLRVSPCAWTLTSTCSTIAVSLSSPLILRRLMTLSRTPTLSLLATTSSTLLTPFTTVSSSLPTSLRLNFLASLRKLVVPRPFPLVFWPPRIVIIGLTWAFFPPKCVSELRSWWLIDNIPFLLVSSNLDCCSSREQGIVEADWDLFLHGLLGRHFSCHPRWIVSCLLARWRSQPFLRQALSIYCLWERQGWFQRRGKLLHSCGKWASLDLLNSHACTQIFF